MSERSTRSGTKRAAPGSESQSRSAIANQPQKRSKLNGSLPKSAASKGSKTLARPDEALKIEEETGDIFAAPSNTLIIHACNCVGSWGGGIAKAFRERYPKAYEAYANHCEEHGHSLLDSAQLISPVDAKHVDHDEVAGEDDEISKTESKKSRKPINPPKHFVGCLFTSRFYGKKKDTRDRILAATKPAMEHLLRQVAGWNSKAEDGEKVKEVRMCKINSGLFGVDWEDSKELLESIDVSESEVKVVKVVSPGS